MIHHPARIYDYWILRNGLDRAIEAGLVHEQHEGPLSIYCYTKQCVFEQAWTPITMMARGLILDHESARVVATPFCKFFNVGEAEHKIPDLPFEVYEKVDGSLIIIYWHDGYWHTATKGSFKSDQAKAAADFLVSPWLNTESLIPRYTYLAEWVSPDNRIVVHYPKSELVMLGVYDWDGLELPYGRVADHARRLGIRAAKRYSFNSVADLVAHADTLPSTEEGFVLKFEDGTRLKVKGEEYRRIHALISRCTPLAMWEAMRNDDDLQAIRRDLPEEFWLDFDTIITLLRKKIENAVLKTHRIVGELAHLSDKEVGLMLDQLPEDIRSFIFPLRKFGSITEGRSREFLFRRIRPTGNRLDGYTPSRSINLVLEEAA